MKKILIALCAVATLASCTKNEVLSYDQEAIGFDNAFVDNSTRSVKDPSFSTSNMFSDFAVFGFVEGASVFDGVRVSKGGDITNTELKQNWKYSGTQYWIAGANYAFYAIAPFSGDWDIKVDSTTTPTPTPIATATGATITFTNDDGTQDLLYAGIVARKGEASGNAAVALTFNHILSKVKFSFVNDYNATSATICVRDIKITNAYNTAEAALASGAAWDEHDGAVEIAFGNATTDDDYAEYVLPAGGENALANFDYASGNTVESYYERFVIPAPSKEWNIKFTVDLLVSGKLIKTYNHTATLTTSFEPGKAYDITATIDATNIDPATSQEPIEFTATMNDWEDGDDENEDRDATVVDNTPQQGNN